MIVVASVSIRHRLDGPRRSSPCCATQWKGTTVTGTTITRLRRRRRFARALELAVLGFVMSLLALSLERSLVGRSGNALQPALR
jgi:hypothetical protein